MGQQQSLDITPPRQVMIVKTKFDSIHLRLLKTMIEESEQGHLLAITMEDGIANIFLVSSQQTMHKAKIEKSTKKTMA